MSKKNSDVGRTQKRGLEKRRQILDAAKELFGTAGYGATSTNRIAVNANVRNGGLYFYYENKEDVLMELLAEYDEAFCKAMDSLSTEGTPPKSDLRARLELLAQTLAALYWPQADFVRELEALRRTMPAVNTVMTSHDERIKQEIVGMLQAAPQESIKIPPDEWYIAANFVYGGIWIVVNQTPNPLSTNESRDFLKKGINTLYTMLV